jgi:predicted enzyme related to lactoylglutathione lyase
MEKAMPAKIGNITFDCNDALLVATFWAGAIGREVDHGGDSGFASIGRSDSERNEAAWFFEKVPEPKAAKNRLHLDLVDSDPLALDRLVSLGATIVTEHTMGSHRWTVLVDPEGNEFCVSDRSFSS